MPSLGDVLRLVVDRDRFPSVSPAVVQPDPSTPRRREYGDDEFDFGLQRFLDGIESAGQVATFCRRAFAARILRRFTRLPERLMHGPGLRGYRSMLVATPCSAGQDA